MDVPTSLAAYAVTLVVVFGGAVGLGRVVGPVGTVGAESASHPTAGPHGRAATPPAADPSPRAGDAAADGLAATDGTWTLQLEQAVLPAGRPATLAFRVVGADGAPLRDYAVEHEQELHLVLVRRDGPGYAHLHPERDGDGRWTTDLRLDQPGSWKAVADFTPAAAAEGVVLAGDLTVPGPVEAPPPLEEQRTATVDGYTVRLSGSLAAGTSSRLVLSVTRAGRPVTDLEPYLGAYGHLVAVRGGDLAYLHVHPEGARPAGATGGPDVAFDVDVPSDATYRLFLDFAHGGQVRTAAFVLSTADGARPAGAPSSSPAAVPHADDGHGHG